MQRIIKLTIVAMLAFASLVVIYAVAPILIPLILITGFFGILSWGIVSLARMIERHRTTRD